MKNYSRTKNTIYNFISSIGGQLITVVMQFVVRTVFIYTLGKSYLGVSGLFYNILYMFSLAELGFGNAIVFKLYEPVANNDRKRILILLDFYKKVYAIIGAVITVLGFILIPFLPYLIKDYDSLSDLNINIVVIYLLYLMESVASYFFLAYKQVIVRVNQKDYIFNIVSYAFTFGSSILQIISLLVFRNFTLYVVILVLRTIGENVICAKLADKYYPFIKDKPQGKLEKKEIKSLIGDCTALFLYKINGVVIKTTDNIVLSIFLGVVTVGLYSNYLIFYTTIKTFFQRVFNAVGHSIGNLHTTHDIDHEYEIFEITHLICAMLGGTAFVGISLVANELIAAWVGESWVVAQPVSLLLGFEIFTLAYNLGISRFRTAYGLFKPYKYRPIAGIIINIVLSVLLVKPLGISGVIIGTIVCEWTTFMPFDPMIIHKFGFNNRFPLRRFYLKLLKYLLVLSVVLIIDYFICSNLLVGFGWLSVIVHALICLVTAPFALYLSSLRTQEGIYIKKFVVNKTSGIFKRIKLR